MEYVRSLDDLMLQINGCRSNEAVMKVFNILFPYDKPLPRGQGDELTLSNFYNDKNPSGDPDLKECHPDQLADNIENETGNAVTEAIQKNRVEDINDLLHLQQQMLALQTANQMAMVNMEYKDEKIMQLTAELEQLKKSKAPVVLHNDTVALEEELQQVKEEMELLKNNYDQEVDRLKFQLTEVGSGNVNNNDVSSEEIQSLREELAVSKQKVRDLEQQFLQEKERNMQLRMKSGRAFMAALENPLTSGGKIKTALYCPNDDNALMRMLQILDQIGGASIE